MSAFDDIQQYQAQIRGLDSLADLDMLLPELFNSLRENYQKQKDGHTYMNDFYGMLLQNEILLHQDSEGILENLSMLLDEMAESQKNIGLPEMADLNTKILQQLLSSSSVI